MNLLRELGLNNIIINDIAIKEYNIFHAIGKYVFGGVNGGFTNVSYQMFITDYFAVKG